MLEQGQGVAKNIEEANKYYRMAFEKYKNAIHSQSNAMFGYASLLFNGKGVDKNEEEAVKYYKLAVSNGNIEAMLEYGKILCEQNNSDKNEEGLALIKKSSDFGNMEAMYEYGRILEEGKLIERNDAESIKYYGKASERGFKKAEDALQRLVSA